jgi:hypothetical protein
MQKICRVARTDHFAFVSTNIWRAEPDRKVAVINGELKRWRIPQILLQQIHVTPSGHSEDLPLVYSSKDFRVRVEGSNQLDSIPLGRSE